MEDHSASYRKVLTLALPFILFLLFFTPAILDPTNVGWMLTGDWGQHFLGWHAYRQAPYEWPYNHENLLAHPTGLSLIYTDSNPILALPLRWLSAILPAHLQYIGPWFLLCLCLHVYIAHRLVKPYAPGPWSALGGALLLSLLPTLYNRISHDTLFAHWLLLWALFIFFEVQSETKKTVLYAALMGICGLIHPYLLIMVAFIWAADQARNILRLLKSRDYPNAGKAFGLAILSLVPAIATLTLSGAFSSGQSAGSDGFGVYGMPLDAPFNPMRKGFALAFLRGPQDPRMAFEGFQYMGLGLLFLLGFALYLYLRTPEGKTAQDVWHKARPLKWPFIILFVLAISNRIHLYNIGIIDLPLPDPVLQVANIVRASGRLFWPIAYTGVFLALVCLFRAAPKMIKIGLPVALALQLLDIGGFAGVTKAMTHAAESSTLYRIAPSPEWERLIKASDLVSFQPPVITEDKAPLYEIALHALDQKVPVSMMYTARENPKQQAIERQGYQDFAKGRLNPKHFYVLLSKAVPAGLESQVRQIDGIWVIPPQSLRDTLKDSPSIPGFVWGQDYVVNDVSPNVTWFDRNWALPDPSGIWTDGSNASLTLPALAPTDRDTILSLTLRGRYKGQKIKVLIGEAGHPYAIQAGLVIGKKPEDVKIKIPKGLLTGTSPVRIEFRLDATDTKAHVGLSRLSLN